MVNKPAPDFSLADQTGTLRTLQEFHGRWLVLYFYPKDDTPGCTQEACAFRDEHAIINQTNDAEVIGINKDSVASHKKFADKHQLNFPLLSNPDHETIEAYGAWQQKNMYGREYMGIQRSTFLINPEGIIVKEYPKVTPQGHAQQIISDLHELSHA